MAVDFCQKPGLAGATRRCTWRALCDFEAEELQEVAGHLGWLVVVGKRKAALEIGARVVLNGTVII